MHQSTNNQPQGQLKKLTGRNKSSDVCYVNDKGGKKNFPIAGAANKAFTRRPIKAYNKQATSGGREKTFSKNERKFSCSASQQFVEKNSNSNDAFAVHNLLNFQYAGSRNVESSNSRRYQFSRRKKAYFNKEEYLQAKCHFVVIGTHDDHSMNNADPDKLVEWDQIQLVHLPTHDPPNCPICLYPPVAAKMTRCGHIFCWSCILHYLNLSEKGWKKCPICHEAVHKNDLKSVKCYVQKKFERLDSITMQLMRRPKSSVFAMPKSGSLSPKKEFSSWIDHTSSSGSKVMFASPEEVLQHILIKERNELCAQLDIDVADENGEDTFISMALQILEEKIKSFKSNDECIGEGVPDESYHDPQEENIDIYDTDGIGSSLSTLLNNADFDRSWEKAFSDDEESEASNLNEDHSSSIDMPTPKISHSYSRGRESKISESSVGSDHTNLDETSQDSGLLSTSVSSEYSCNPNGSTNSYHFYQAEDGQNIFLHSLNARCVIEEYGSLDDGPLKITGQIIDFECFTMTKELRKRFRYLSHLPLTSEFMICELILKPPLLSKNTIHNFMPEFKNRKALRIKKFKEQQRFDRQATAAGNKQHGFRSLEYEEDDFGIDLSNTSEFPSSLSPDSNEAEGNCHEEKSEFVTQQFQGLSFAQMLNKKMDAVNSPKECTTIVGRTRGNGSIQTLSSAGRAVDDDEDGGPEIVAPDFKETFSAAMFASPLKQESTTTAYKGKNGKKKKEKGMLLFATGGQRKY